MMTSTTACQSVRLAPHAPSARRARRFVSAALAEWGMSSLEDTATLLVSELVTNGLLHAHTGMRLEVRRTRSGVRVEVGDGSAKQALRRFSALDSVGGRGLELVGALSDDWGVVRRGGGKGVWFALTED